MKAGIRRNIEYRTIRTHLVILNAPCHSERNLVILNEVKNPTSALPQRSFALLRMTFGVNEAKKLIAVLRMTFWRTSEET